MVATDDLNWYLLDVQVDVAQNGLEALKRCQKSQYDVILMDVQMPVMNAYEATSEIRKLESGSETPVLAMTASLLKDDIDRILSAGMNGCIPKPYQPIQLVEAIFEAVNNPKLASTAQLS